MTIALSRVVRAREQCLGFDAIHQFAQRIQLALQVGGHVLAFFSQIEIGGDVVGPAHQVAFQRQCTLSRRLRSRITC